MELKKPKTRAQCAQVPRPCPFVSCRYHLYLDVFPSGRVKLNFPGVDVCDLQRSCALDEAEGEGLILEEVATRLGDMTRERVRQIEDEALDKLHIEYTGEDRTVKRNGRAK